MTLFAFSFLFTVLLMPISIRGARAVGAVDVPDGERKLHARPTARLGGLAVFLSVLLAGLFLLPDTPLRAALLSGGALLCVLGISDDVFSLSPAVKLTAQAAVAFIPACFSLYPRAITLLGLVFPLPELVGVLLSAAFLVLLSNAFNLVDGADMLCTLEGMCGALALLPFVPEAASLLGALFGFLPYNRASFDPFSFRKTPTRSFLGDTGALFIGYALGLFALGMHPFPLFSLLFFALPLYEVGSSFLRRAARGKNPFRADCDHLHHRLLRRGYSPSLGVLLLFLYALLFASVGVLLIEVFP